MDDLLWNQCLITPTQSLEGRHFYSPSVQDHWNHLLRLVVSLPELTANRLRLNVK